MNSNIHLHSLQPLPKLTQKKVAQPRSERADFQRLLQNELAQPAELKLSKHAQQRMNLRGIEFSSAKWQTIEAKVEEAKRKGVTDSLVITRDAALVVSAKNDTVITVLNREEAESQIFTNINGTIVID